MQRNQWKTAAEQLLRHWYRSGISQVPAGTQQSVAAVTSWLDLNSAVVFEDSDFNESESPNMAASSSTIVEEIVLNSLGICADAGIEDNSRHKVSGPITTAKPESQKSSVTLRTANQPERVQSVGKWNSPSLAVLDRKGVMDSLNEQVIACRKCEEIVCRRQRTVFGAGANDARVVMFGEAPGADEDRVGEPFVGAAGQLLNKILVASGLKREEVYIVNALKCRPPNNRTPTDSEIENCRPFFESQLETIQPDYIVCWGSVAVRAVLGSTDSVGRLRGRFHSFRGAKVMVTYHPAYLLRTPDAKKLTWEDMKMLMQDMGSPILPRP